MDVDFSARITVLQLTTGGVYRSSLVSRSGAGEASIVSWNRGAGLNAVTLMKFSLSTTPFRIVLLRAYLYSFAPTLNNNFTQQRIALGMSGKVVEVHDAQLSHDLIKTSERPGLPVFPASPLLFFFPLSQSFILMVTLTISGPPNPC